MDSTNDSAPHLTHPERWARFRFAVVGRLFVTPPASGELATELRDLEKKSWAHPLTGDPLTISFATIERWYYLAKDAQRDPLRALRRAARRDAGRFRAITSSIADFLRAQHADHPRWTYELHFENLAAAIRAKPELGTLPSYPTVRRYMQRTGLVRQKRRGRAAEIEVHEQREVRSFEVEHPSALWHLDFHEASRSVLTDDGEWITPFVVAILDDYSRVVVHCQWFLREDTDVLVHAMIQAIMRFGLPRGLLSDNGGPMTSEEFTSGLARFGIEHSTTLPYSPHQNGKQETWWGSLEGRLIALLQRQRNLSLRMLNDATAPWVHDDYNRRFHREIGMTPLERFLADPKLVRPTPPADVLRSAFRRDIRRTVRRSDGTISIDAVRFELPQSILTLKTVLVRYAKWDLTNVHLVDERTGDTTHRIYPLDKHHNADGRRRLVDAGPIAAGADLARSGEALPPLLEELLRNQQASGLPPAYLPMDDERSSRSWDLGSVNDKESKP